jgi:hypothetical protein
LRFGLVRQSVAYRCEFVGRDKPQRRHMGKLMCIIQGSDEPLLNELNTCMGA